METKKEFTTMENGWRREVVYRKSGATAGRADVYYHSPCGKRFRSRLQVREFLGEAFNPAEFDFHATHAAGYVPPARTSSSSGGGGGAGKPHRASAQSRAPRHNDSRLARAVKNLQHQRPISRQPQLERNYCGLVRQPVTCLLPQSHDMVLAKCAPASTAQKTTLHLRDSQWMHEQRLHHLHPVDGLTGEAVPVEQLAFHNRPMPQLRALAPNGMPVSGVKTSPAAAVKSPSTTSAGAGSTAMNSPAGRQHVAAGVVKREPNVTSPAAKPVVIKSQTATPPLHSLTPLVKAVAGASPLLSSASPKQGVPVACRTNGPQATISSAAAAAAAALANFTGAHADANAWAGARIGAAPASNSRQMVASVATAHGKTASLPRTDASTSRSADASTSRSADTASISDMDIHIQEERVRQLKEKLLLAAGK
ncbi:uncharacterized protein LOC135825811 isoform X2 [Sycon ciliatum]|uniref:uncharacterized protein LOC135825811 isoform X2 n=1 Tax=Sycon ciliatum TaxID=27933 RepID=UPI0031F65F74